MKAYALILIAILGCSKPVPQLSLIHAGMEEPEVITLLGKPASVSEQGNTRYLTYEAWGYNYNEVVRTNQRTYFVRFVSGKVESFGQVGDFDSQHK